MVGGKGFRKLLALAGEDIEITANKATIPDKISFFMIRVDLRLIKKFINVKLEIQDLKKTANPYP